MKSMEWSGKRFRCASAGATLRGQHEKLFQNHFLFSLSDQNFECTVRRTTSICCSWVSVVKLTA